MKTIKFKFLYKTLKGNIKESDVITWTCNCDIFLHSCNEKSLDEYLKDIPDMFTRYKKYYRGSYYGFNIIELRGFENARKEN